MKNDSCSSSTLFKLSRLYILNPRRASTLAWRFLFILLFHFSISAYQVTHCLYFLREVSICVVFILSMNILGFPAGAVAEKPLANAGDSRDAGSVPGLGRSPGEGNGYSLQHSCLESSMDRRAWWATVHGVAKTERLTHMINHNGKEYF